jgi:hypothetical protein
MGLKQFFSGETLVLIAPLPVADCVDRLRGAMTNGGGSFPAAPVSGIVHNDWLQVCKVLPKGTKNSFQTFLRATLTAEGSSTRLTCHSGMHPLVAVFTLFWFALVLVFALGFTFLSLHPRDDIDIPDPAFIVPLMMLPMGIGLVFFARHHARAERQFLLDFLRDTIGARPAPETIRAESVIQR